MVSYPYPDGTIGRLKVDNKTMAAVYYRGRWRITTIPNLGIRGNQFSTAELLAMGKLDIAREFITIESS